MPDLDSPSLRPRAFLSPTFRGFVAASLIGICSGSAAHAQECDVSSLAKSAARADIIVEATVTQAEEVQTSSGWQRLRLRVDTVFKAPATGSALPPVLESSHFHCWSQPFGVKGSSPYIWFLSRDGADAWVSSCCAPVLPAYPETREETRAAVAASKK